MRENTTLAIRPTCRSAHSSTQLGMTHLDREEKCEEEGSGHLEEIRPCAHPPQKEQIMRGLGKNCKLVILSPVSRIGLTGIDDKQDDGGEYGLLAW